MRPVAVMTAVGPETRAVLAAIRRPIRVPLAGFRAWSGTAGERPITVVQGGIGPERARAALHALDVSHGLIVSAGFAGALVPNAVAGDLVLPGAVVWELEASVERYDVPAATWRAARNALPAALAASALHGAILSSATVVASVAAKRSAAARTGAVAVEMEAAALIAIARERGLDVLVLRTILDGADVSLEGLPADLEQSWRARARLIGTPSAWPQVLSLARQVPRAARSLTEAAASVLAAL